MPEGSSGAAVPSAHLTPARGAEQEEDGGAGSAASGNPVGGALGASFVGSALIQVLNIGTGVILARGLGPAGRGALAAALLWPMLVGAIALLGVMEAATYHAARNTAPVGSLVGSGLVLVAAQAVVFSMLCAAVLPFALGRHSHGTLEASYVYLAYIPINAISLFLAGVLNGRQRYASFQTVRIMVIALTAVLILVLWALGMLTVLHAVIVYIVASGVTMVLAWAITLKEVDNLTFSPNLARELFAYGIRSHASTVSSQFNERLDQLVISVFLTSSKLGIYVIAVTLTSATYLVGGSVAYVALPEIARLSAGDTRNGLARRFLQLTLLCSLLVSVPVALFAGPLVDLFFGHAFAPSTPIARVLLIAAVVLGANRVLEAILRAVGRPLDAGIAEFIALGATFAGLATLLPLLGLMGAAVASLLAYGVSSAWMLRRASLAFGIPVRRLLDIDRQDVAWLRLRLRPSRTLSRLRDGRAVRRRLRRPR